MKTPINDSPIETDLPAVLQANADYLFQRYSRNYPLMLSAGLDNIEDSWQRASVRLEGDWNFDTRFALEQTRQWARHCCIFIFWSGFMMRVPPTAEEEQQMPDLSDRAMAHQVRRLLRRVKKIIHELQRDRHDTTVTEMTAMYAEAICGTIRATLGTVKDDTRYHHSERAAFVLLHARTKRRIANLFVRWAQADEELAKEFDR